MAAVQCRDEARLGCGRIEPEGGGGLELIAPLGARWEGWVLVGCVDGWVWVEGGGAGGGCWWWRRRGGGGAAVRGRAG
eukprot:2402892-Prymnesium_polylepis.1